MKLSSDSSSGTERPSTCPIRRTTGSLPSPSWTFCCHFLCEPSSSSAAALPASAASSAGTSSRCHSSSSAGAQSGCGISPRLWRERRRQETRRVNTSAGRQRYSGAGLTRFNVFLICCFYILLVVQPGSAVNHDGPTPFMS